MHETVMSSIFLVESYDSMTKNNILSKCQCDLINFDTIFFKL